MTKTNDDMARAILEVVKGLSGDAAVIEVASLLQDFRESVAAEARREGWEEGYDEGNNDGYDAAKAGFDRFGGI